MLGMVLCLHTPRWLGAGEQGRVLDHELMAIVQSPTQLGQTAKLKETTVCIGLRWYRFYLHFGFT